MRALTGPAVIAFLTALLLTGCGGGQPNDTSASDQAPQNQSGSSQAGSTPDSLSYAQCMRDHGVDMADPDPSTGRPQLGDGVDPGSPAVQDAMTSCQDLMPAGAREQSGTQDVEAYLAFADCMRENGLPEFPDPQPGSAGGLFGGTGIDRDDPVFQQASQTCQPILGGQRP